MARTVRPEGDSSGPVEARGRRADSPSSGCQGWPNSRQGPASPALMTPCTPVSWRQRSTSRRHWMLPLANTGMATAFLSASGAAAAQKRGRWPLTPRQGQPPPHPRLPTLGPQVRSPHRLDVLPGRRARQGPLLLLGAPVHGQQLEHSPPSTAPDHSGEAAPCPALGPEPSPLGWLHRGRVTWQSHPVCPQGEGAGRPRPFPGPVPRKWQHRHCPRRGWAGLGRRWPRPSSRSAQYCPRPGTSVGLLHPSQGLPPPAPPRAPGPHLAASLLQHLGVSHRLVDLGEDTDLARDGNREFLVGQQNWGKAEWASGRCGGHLRAGLQGTVCGLPLGAAERATSDRHPRSDSKGAAAAGQATPHSHLPEQGQHQGQEASAGPRPLRSPPPKRPQVPAGSTRPTHSSSAAGPTPPAGRRRSGLRTTGTPSAPAPGPTQASGCPARAEHPPDTRSERPAPNSSSQWGRGAEVPGERLHGGAGRPRFSRTHLSRGSPTTSDSQLNPVPTLQRKEPREGQLPPSCPWRQPHPGLRASPQPGAGTQRRTPEPESPRLAIICGQPRFRSTASQ